jgi:deazaflavin-dependent oxidoreductase (nitroreductase family)
MSEVNIEQAIKEAKADPAAFDFNAWNATVIKEFRENHGQVGGPMFGGHLVVILHNKGARSGIVRENPLVATRDGEGYVIIASKGGAPKHPDWYHNLVAHPDAELEVGEERFPVRARLTEGAERRRLFDKQAEQMPNFKEYEKLAPREIPVFVLKRV